MSGDIFEQDGGGFDLADDPGDIGPQMARVVRAAPLPRRAERLAGITGKDDMNAATPRAAIEGFDIVINRGLAQVRVRHPAHEGGRGPCVPFDETNSLKSGFSDFNSKVQSPGTGAEG